MAKAYVPGLTISRDSVWKVKRLLPIPGEILVSKGQTVTSQTIVARAELPGEPFPINISRQLQVAPSEISKYLEVKIGDRVTEGAELAYCKGLFGWMPRNAEAPCSGVIESISQLTGQLLIRGNPRSIDVKGYLSGVISDIIPQEGVVVSSKAAVVQGIFGIGPEAYGEIVFVVDKPDELITKDLITQAHAGKVIVGGGRVTYEAIQQAIAIGASAMICGGIDDADLRQLLGYDLGVAITGSETLGITLVITEGFGDIPMAKRTFELLMSQRGRQASCNGATQIRAGVMRPEIVIPQDDQSSTESVPSGGSSSEPAYLTIGAPVRIIRDPWFGVIGKVASLPHEPTRLPSGAKARVLMVETGTGEPVMVPRANVELLES